MTSVGESSFRNCYGFKGTIKLMNSIRGIEKYAFYNCYGFSGTLTLSQNL